MSEENRATWADNWLGYRDQIKVVDVTIRDGGLMNDHQFTDDVVSGVYAACVASGIDYMEIGYINSQQQFPPDEFGAWKHCREEDLRRIVGDNNTSLKLAAMADAEKSDYKTDILPAAESVLDMIRVATYIHQMPLALDMVKDASDKGYETTLNLMAVSTVPESEVRSALEMLVHSDVGAVYVVDSFGSLYSEQIRALYNMFFEYCEGTSIEIGIHAHNNRQLAFANTIEAVVLGANCADASFAGLGRGAGNCQMELLLGFLHNPKFRLRPVLKCIEEHVEPLRSQLLWGYDYPYMLTGLLNQHPRAGMAFNASEDRGKIVQFYDQMEEQD